MRVTAAEVFCPVGLDLVQAATSVLTGVSRVEATSLMDDRFQPVTMGLVPEAVMAPIDEKIQAAPYMTAHTVRLLKLLSPCLQNLAARGLPLATMPLLLAVPGPADKPHGAFFDGFFSHLEAQSQVTVDLPKCRLYENGRAGFFEALKDAAALIAAGDRDHVLVGGVDSLLDPMDISRYLGENRIMRENVMDGFTPGEGAAVMVVSRPGAEDGPSAPLARILGVGLGQEEGHRYSDEPYRGDGLAAAFTALFDAVGPLSPPVATVFAGFNGESFNAKEWGVAYLRHKNFFSEDIRMEHPAEYFGDARAALPAIMTAIGAFGLDQRIFEGPIVVWASSDDAPRGVALITGTAP